MRGVTLHCISSPSSPTVSLFCTKASEPTIRIFCRSQVLNSIKSIFPPSLPPPSSSSSSLLLPVILCLACPPGTQPANSAATVQMSSGQRGHLSSRSAREMQGQGRVGPNKCREKKKTTYLCCGLLCHGRLCQCYLQPCADSSRDTKFK